MSIINGRKVYGNPNSLEKLASVAGSTVRGQGTSRAIYHALTLTADRSYEFFVNLNNTLGVFKNLDTNKLSIGEALAIKRISFLLYLHDAVNPELINGVGGIALPHFLAGKIDLIIGNQTILKDYPISKVLSINNAAAKFNGQAYIELENEIVLEPNVEFKVVLKQLGVITVVPANAKLAVMLEGYGKIYNGKKTL